MLQPIFIGRVLEESGLRLEKSYQGINQEKTTGDVLDRTNEGRKTYIGDTYKE
jgi:hypothetical protein